MEIQLIKVQGKKLFRSTDADVSKLEALLWITLPAEYRQYVTQLGEGVLGGSLIRIYPPKKILAELEGWRARIRKYWFWEKSQKLLPKQRALEAVILGDTLQGDELIFHPMKPDRFFVLPRGGEKAFELQGSFLDALEWMCSSGKLTKPFKERNFEPFDGKKSNASIGIEEQEMDQTLETTVSTLQKWTDKKKLVKIAERQCKEWIAEEEEPFYGNGKKEVDKKKVKVVFKSQALVFVTDKHHDPVVVTKLQLLDSETGFEFGLFESHTELDGEGSESRQLHHNVAKALSRFLGKVE